MNWWLSLIFLSFSFTLHHELVLAQNATAASILTSSLSIPSDRATLATSGALLAVELKSSSGDGEGDGDQEGSSGDDDDSDDVNQSTTNQVDAATVTSSSRSSSKTSSTHSANNKPQAVPTAAAHAPTHTGSTHPHTFPSQSTHFTFHPHPVPTSSFDGPNNDPFVTSPSSNTSSSHKSAGTIAGAVIGALALVALLLCCGRSFYKYRRMPGRDRVVAILERHRLERELEEMEEANPIARRTSLIRPPPPAYQHAPAYEEISDEGTTPTAAQSSARSEAEEPGHRPP